MNTKETLLNNIDKIKTTKLGVERIKNNLKINNPNIIKYIKQLIKNNNSNIYKKGKNFYCEINNIIITINSFSYTVITAHILKKKG